MFGNVGLTDERIAEVISDRSSSYKEAKISIVDGIMVVGEIPHQDGGADAGLYATTVDPTKVIWTGEERNSGAILSIYLSKIRMMNPLPIDDLLEMPRKEYVEGMGSNKKVEIFDDVYGEIYKVPRSAIKSDTELPKFLDKTVIGKVGYAWKREYAKNLKEISLLGWK